MGSGASSEEKAEPKGRYLVNGGNFDDKPKSGPTTAPQGNAAAARARSAKAAAETARRRTAAATATATAMSDEADRRTLTKNADPTTLKILQLMQEADALPTEGKAAEKLRVLQQCYPLLQQVPAARFDHVAMMVYQKEGEVYHKSGEIESAKESYTRAITLAEKRVARGEKDLYMVLKRYVLAMVGLARIWYEHERDVKGFTFADAAHPRIAAVDAGDDDAASDLSSLASTLSSGGSVFSLNQEILKSMAPRPPRSQTGPNVQRVRMHAPHEIKGTQFTMEDEITLRSKMTRELVASPCELLLLRCCEVVELGLNCQSELLIPPTIELAQIYEDLQLYSRALLLVRKCLGILCNVFDYDHPWVMELMERADRLNLLREEQLRNEAATKIQSTWKMHRAMEDLEDVLGHPVKRHVWIPRKYRTTPELTFLNDFVDDMPVAAEEDEGEFEEPLEEPLDDDVIELPYVPEQARGPDGRPVADGGRDDPYDPSAYAPYPADDNGDNDNPSGYPAAAEEEEEDPNAPADADDRLAPRDTAMEPVIVYDPTVHDGEVVTHTTMAPNARVVGTTQDTETDTHVEPTEFGDVVTVRTTTVTKTVTEKLDSGGGDDDDDADASSVEKPHCPRCLERQPNPVCPACTLAFPPLACVECHHNLPFPVPVDARDPRSHKIPWPPRPVCPHCRAPQSTAPLTCPYCVVPSCPRCRAPQPPPTCRECGCVQPPPACVSCHRELPMPDPASSAYGQPWPQDPHQPARLPPRPVCTHCGTRQPPTPPVPPRCPQCHAPQPPPSGPAQCPYCHYGAPEKQSRPQHQGPQPPVPPLRDLVDAAPSPSYASSTDPPHPAQTPRAGVPSRCPSCHLAQPAPQCASCGYVVPPPRCPHCYVAQPYPPPCDCDETHPHHAPAPLCWHCGVPQPTPQEQWQPDPNHPRLCPKCTADLPARPPPCPYCGFGDPYDESAYYPEPQEEEAAAQRPPPQRSPKNAVVVAPRCPAEAAGPQSRLPPHVSDPLRPTPPARPKHPAAPPPAQSRKPPTPATPPRSTHPHQNPSPVKGDDPTTPPRCPRCRLAQPAPVCEGCSTALPHPLCPYCDATQPYPSPGEANPAAVPPGEPQPITEPLCHACGLAQPPVGSPRRPPLRCPSCHTKATPTATAPACPFCGYGEPATAASSFPSLSPTTPRDGRRSHNASPPRPSTMHTGKPGKLSPMEDLLAPRRPSAAGPASGPRLPPVQQQQRPSSSPAVPPQTRPEAGKNAAVPYRLSSQQQQQPLVPGGAAAVPRAPMFRVVRDYTVEKTRIRRKYHLGSDDDDGDGFADEEGEAESMISTPAEPDFLPSLAGPSRPEDVQVQRETHISADGRTKTVTKTTSRRVSAAQAGDKSDYTALAHAPPQANAYARSGAGQNGQSRIRRA